MGSEQKKKIQQNAIRVCCMCVKLNKKKKNSHTQNTWKQVIELHTGFGYNFSEQMWG